MVLYQSLNKLIMNFRKQNYRFSFLSVILIWISCLFFINACNTDDRIELAKGFYYDTGMDRLFGKNDCDIPPTIKKIEFCGNYLIIKQELLRHLLPEANYNLDSEDYRHGLECDYYWIIDTRGAIRYGPYDYEEFRSMCDSLKLSSFSNCYQVSFKDRVKNLIIKILSWRISSDG